MSTSLLDFFSGAVKKAVNEWAAPCPACGGKDRLVIKTDTGRWFCRQCGLRGDDVDAAKRFGGMSFRESCRAMGREVPYAGKGFARLAGGGGGAAPGVNAGTKSPPSLPGQKWRASAAAFLARCQGESLYTPNSMENLVYPRALTPETCQVCGIGWHERDTRMERAAWGLGPGRLFLPRGIVISVLRSGGVVGLTIRRLDETHGRFMDVAGGASVPFIVGKRGTPVVLVESALDAVLLWQEAHWQGVNIAAVGFMGGAKAPDDFTIDFIRAAPVVLVCPDNDTGGKAAWQRWRSWFPEAVLAPPLAAGDLGEMHRLALNTFGREAPTVFQWLQGAMKLAQNSYKKAA